MTPVLGFSKGRVFFLSSPLGEPVTWAACTPRAPSARVAVSEPGTRAAASTKATRCTPERPDAPQPARAAPSPSCVDQNRRARRGVRHSVDGSLEDDRALKLEAHWALPSARAGLVRESAGSQRRNKGKCWSRWPESNRRPADYEEQKARCAALRLITVLCAKCAKPLRKRRFVGPKVLLRDSLAFASNCLPRAYPAFA